MKIDNRSWIAVQGIDGSGKTTLVNHLSDILKSKDLDVTTLKACGSGAISSKLKYLYVNNLIPSSIRDSVSAFMHLEHFKEVNDALDAGKCVISDRWVGCYYSYNHKLFEQYDAYSLLSNLIMNDNINTIKPNLLIQIITDPDIALERLKNREENNKLDKLNKASLIKLNKAYMEFISVNSKYLSNTDIIVVFNNYETEEEFLDKVIKRLGL